MIGIVIITAIDISQVSSSITDYNLQVRPVCSLLPILYEKNRIIPNRFIPPSKDDEIMPAIKYL